eukprot:6074082-Alexandrium_andersonii.AAC.1
MERHTCAGQAVFACPVFGLERERVRAGTRVLLYLQTHGRDALAHVRARARARASARGRARALPCFRV